MATKTLTQIFNEVAQAIQEKKGSSTPISAEDFGTEIANLPSGGSGDPTPFIIPYESNIIIHLDKLKQYLPTEILNTHLTYYEYTDNQWCLAAQGSQGEFGPIQILYATCVTSMNADSVDFELCDIGTGDIDKDNNTLSSVYFRVSSLDSIDPINNVSIFNTMTVENLIENIIEANNSNVILCNFDWGSWTHSDASVISISGIISTICSTFQYPSGEYIYYSSNKIIPNSQLKEIFTLADE